MPVPLDTLLADLAAAIAHAVTPFGDALLAADPSLIRDFETDASPSFPLRAFATFIRRPRGDELAVTVEVQIVGDKLVVESDIFTDAGELVALGPTMEADLPADLRMDAALFDGWRLEFAVFLAASVEPAQRAAARLT